MVLSQPRRHILRETIEPIVYELREIVEVLEAEVAKAHSSGRLDVGPPAASGWRSVRN